MTHKLNHTGNFAIALASGINEEINHALKQIEEKKTDPMQRAIDTSIANPQDKPLVLWGFFWMDCVHDGGPVLQSIHVSKRSALRAMIRAQSARWDKSRENTKPSLCRAAMREFDYRLQRQLEDYSVHHVVVQP